jgi:hypothetical protein
MQLSRTDSVAETRHCAAAVASPSSQAQPLRVQHRWLGRRSLLQCLPPNASGTGAARQMFTQCYLQKGQIKAQEDRVELVVEIHDSKTPSTLFEFPASVRLARPVTPAKSTCCVSVSRQRMPGSRPKTGNPRKTPQLTRMTSRIMQMPTLARSFRRDDFDFAAAVTARREPPQRVWAGQPGLGCPHTNPHLQNCCASGPTRPRSTPRREWTPWAN